MPNSPEKSGWIFLAVGFVALFLGTASLMAPETATLGCGLNTFGGLMAIVGGLQLI